jgi:hypothetical protein
MFNKCSKNARQKQRIPLQNFIGCISEESTHWSRGACAFLHTPRMVDIANHIHANLTRWQIPAGQQHFKKN